MVVHAIPHFGDPGGRENFCTVDTWKVGHISDTAFDTTAAPRRIRDSVLFRVDGRLFVPFANSGEVRRPGKKSIVTCGDDPVLPISAADNDAAHMEPLARRTGRKQHCRRHEVLVPARSRRELGGRVGDQIDGTDRIENGSVNVHRREQSARRIGRKPPRGTAKGDPLPLPGRSADLRQEAQN